MKEKYYFGKSLIKEVDFFAFPRTGSHYFCYCLSGLFDLVGYPNEFIDNAEAISRQNEINPMVLYALELREDGVPYQPAFFNTLSFGVHAKPKFRGRKFIVLIRNPIAVAYSYYRVVTSRWGGNVSDIKEWVKEQFCEYIDFYNTAFDEIKQNPSESILVSYENLLRDSNEMIRLVDFVGLRPKLSPEFVYTITKFETFASNDVDRTFYREGKSDAWKRDLSWTFVEELVTHFDFSRFGY